MKKLFIVAPYSPPSSTPPAQRVRFIIKHAASLGYYPTIFTVESKFRDEVEDPWMLDLVGKDFNQILVKCFDQKKTRKLKFGDLGLRMLPFLFSKLYTTSKKQKPDFILYSVPPWYVLLIAPIIKRLTGVKYGIDFIDPWVYDLHESETSIKKRVSHWVSKKFEKYVCKDASIIYSVSTGINDDIINRNPELKLKTFVAIPYGAEQTDFNYVQTLNSNNKDVCLIRYIGAIWFDCYKVLDGLMAALAIVGKTKPIKIEFYGTSYAREQMSKPQLDNWILLNKMESYTSENSLRVTYKRAIQLTLQADILLLIGGMAPYYAASKLMGLLVSKKLFIAFVHEDSFPCKLLKEIGYPYVVTYNSTNKLPVNQVIELSVVIEKAIATFPEFTGVDLSHPFIEQHSAFGMTRSFIEPIKKIVA